MMTFGPVPSRRLGKSLGINNIIRPKYCSYSCIYCQAGITRRVSVAPRSFFSPEETALQVSLHLQKLHRTDYPDYLTFVSNGEPTLDENLGATIGLLKEQFRIPVAVITNASLIHREEVASGLTLADWVSVKIDAPDAEIWQTINRPAPELNFSRIIEGILIFAQSYKGILCTETMLLRGINDEEETLNRLADIVARVAPAKSYLSVPIRPPARLNARIPDEEALTAAWHIYTSRGIHTELLNAFEGVNTGYTGDASDDILKITAVHPLREDALAEILRKDKSGFGVVRDLLDKNLLSEIDYGGKKFYLRKME